MGANTARLPLRAIAIMEDSILNKRVVGATLVAALSVAAIAQAQTVNGYVQDARGAVVKTGSGLCLRTAYWTPAMATEECDASLVKKEAPAPVVQAPPPPPPPAPVAPPPPPPPPAAPKAVSVVLKGSFFDFNKASLKPAAQGQLDAEVVAKVQSFGRVKQVIVSGHTDRIGKPAYNQKLSEKRAEAVKAYLVGKGVDGQLIDTFGFGATQPAQGVPKCDDKLPRKKLIECLEPHRRVVIDIQPAAK